MKLLRLIAGARFLMIVSGLVLVSSNWAEAQLFTFSKQDLIDYTAKSPFDRLPDGRPKVPDSMNNTTGLPLSACLVWQTDQNRSFHR